MVMINSYVRVGRMKPLSVRDAEETVEKTRKRVKETVCYQTTFAVGENGEVKLLAQPPKRFYFGNPDTDIGMIVQEEVMLPPNFLLAHDYRRSLGEQGGLRELWRRLTAPPWLGVYEKIA